MLRLIIAVAVTMALWAFGSQGRNTDVAATGTSPPDHVALGTLLDAPDRYDGRRVRVSGLARERVVVAGLGGFRLLDDADRSLIVTSSAGAPAPGTSITVTGRFRILFAAGNANVSGMVDADWYPLASARP